VRRIDRRISVPRSVFSPPPNATPRTPPPVVVVVVVGGRTTAVLASHGRTTWTVAGCGWHAVRLRPGADVRVTWRQARRWGRRVGSESAPSISARKGTLSKRRAVVVHGCQQSQFAKVMVSSRVLCAASMLRVTVGSRPSVGRSVGPRLFSGFALKTAVFVKV
jgi:hypothetical protein